MLIKCKSLYTVKNSEILVATQGPQKWASSVFLMHSSSEKEKKKNVTPVEQSCNRAMTQLKRG